MAGLDNLEKTLDGVFVKSAPALPENGKKTLVTWVPWINLILGVLSLLAAWSLWNWAHVANSLVDYANSISQAVGGGNVVSNRLTATIWISIVVIAVTGVLYLLAFQPTQKMMKSGWNLMFYAMLLQVVYAVVEMFSNYSSGSPVGTIIGTVIGLWFLFQIRSKYTGIAKASK
jgi:hypothetical protein